MTQFRFLLSVITAVLVGVGLDPSAASAQSASLAGHSAVVRPVVTVVDTSADLGVANAAGPRIVPAGFIPAGASADSIQGTSGSRGLGAGPHVALMGVGVAAIVVGSLVGGDGGTIIAIGGGVLALIGLFRYLR